ncbi:IS630 family transposase [Parageobacillus thermoglucosidasius]|uniref:IS630 family transposase n=1 Tax=Parageobacillus thermoglucosidasius TaxID=1426 RepID=UPI001FCB9396|nr:IS630 family transposase [Parageobacillus thermoglucosidasius]
MVIIYEDESHIRDYQTLRVTWSVKGRQKQIPTYGHHATVSLLGGVNIETGEFHCMETNQCDAQAFLQFLQYTLDQYPDKHVVMVLDNAKIHRAKILQPFLHEHEERLTLIFLPPYSPNLNLVERIWGWLKESVIANRFHANRKELRESIVSFLEHLTQFPEKVLQRIGQIVMSEN